MKGVPQDAGQQSTLEEEELRNEDSTDNAPDSFPSSQPWANIYDTFMPLLLSMTFNSPLKFWELTYMQQQQQFNSTEDDQEKLRNLTVWFGFNPILVALNELQLMSLDPTNSTILDVGCGNGHVCQLMHSMGYHQVYGIDFSDAAIRLATQIMKLYKQQQNPESSNDSDIMYSVQDALNTTFDDDFFDLIYDKGTFDSIACVSKNFVKSKDFVDPEEQEEQTSEEITSSSAPDAVYESQNVGPSDDVLIIPNGTENEGDAEEDDRQAYCQEINRILKPGKYFFITSSCHDREELLNYFGRRDGEQQESGGCDFVLVKDLSDMFDDLRVMIFQKPSHEQEQEV